MEDPFMHSFFVFIGELTGWTAFFLLLILSGSIYIWKSEELRSMRSRLIEAQQDAFDSVGVKSLRARLKSERDAAIAITRELEAKLEADVRASYERGRQAGRDEMQPQLSEASVRLIRAREEIQELYRQLGDPEKRVKRLRLEAEEKTLREFLDKKEEKVAPPKRPFAGIDES